MSESPYITTCDVRAPQPEPWTPAPLSQAQCWPADFSAVGAALRGRVGGLDVHDLARLSGVALGRVRDVVAMLSAGGFIRRIDLHGHDLWFIPGAAS